MRAQCYVASARVEDITLRPGRSRPIWRMVGYHVNKSDAPKEKKKPTRWSLSWQRGKGWVS
jgi:hypothetical protein